jgi:hypothetical protein
MAEARLGQMNERETFGHPAATDQPQAEVDLKDDRQRRIVDGRRDPFRLLQPAAALWVSSEFRRFRKASAIGSRGACNDRR